MYIKEKEAKNFNLIIFYFILCTHNVVILLYKANKIKSRLLNENKN